MKNPVRRYRVTWQYPHSRQVLAYAGSFRRCDELIARLIKGGRAVDIAGYGWSGVEDTWLFPSACGGYPEYPSKVGVL